MKPDYSKARRHLMKADPKLGRIIKRVGPCGLHSVAPKDPFEALTMSIASQQLSTKAAATIFGRFCDLFPPDRKLRKKGERWRPYRSVAAWYLWASLNL